MNKLVLATFILAATTLAGSAFAQQQGGLPQPASDQEKLLGNWKLVSFYTEDVQTKHRNDVYGARPIGHAALTPSGRLFAVITADGRKPPKAPEEQAAAFRSMIAYTGKFRIEGEKLTTKVDAAWNEAWVGTEQVRFWKLEGDRLHIITAPIPNPDVPDGLMIGVLVWERE
jgi:Lipocalin-like domain